ncbi:MAG: hypothetical protein LBF90_01055, partial [Prevotellaceae bacterium]|nr:hypothetical protein [Prevotellaceae bacterium]
PRGARMSHSGARAEGGGVCSIRMLKHTDNKGPFLRDKAAIAMAIKNRLEGLDIAEKGVPLHP